MSIDLQETALYRANDNYTFLGNANGKSDHPEYSQLEGTYSGFISGNRNYSDGDFRLRLRAGNESVSSRFMNRSVYRQ